MTNLIDSKLRSLRSLEWLNFFLADVQTGLGPFLAAYLASSGWNPGRVGYALTFGGLVSVAMQTPAGAIIDAMHRKRALLAGSLGVLVAGTLATMVGIGAAASTTIGGVLIQHLGYRASFLGLAGIALLAFALLWFAVPETLSDFDTVANPTSESKSEKEVPTR